ncbi:MAG: GIY-YIG nuclease family protein [Pirellulaceae bacterium]
MKPEFEGSIELSLETPNPVSHTLQLLLEQSGVDLTDALIMRHTPQGGRLRAALPSLAETDLDTFNAYQSIQNPKHEKMLQKKGWLIALVVDGAGQTIFAGVFRKVGEVKDAAKIAAADRLLAVYDFQNTDVHDFIWFELSRTEHLAEYRGRLVVENWSGQSWCRHAATNPLKIIWMAKESLLVPPKIPDWRDIVWTVNDIVTMPYSWQIAMAEWTAIYLIHDAATNKNYVGSAYGAENLLTRWQGYAHTGNNGNKYMPKDSSGFAFTILERLSPDALPSEVIKRESNWKRRLHTIYPQGMNGNA